MPNQSSLHIDASATWTALPVDISQIQAETYMKEYFVTRQPTNATDRVQAEILYLLKSATLEESSRPERLLCETPSMYLEALQAVDTEKYHVLILVHAESENDEPQDPRYLNPMMSAALMQSTFRRFDILPSFARVLSSEQLFLQHITPIVQALDMDPTIFVRDFCYGIQLPAENARTGISLHLQDQPFNLSSYVKLDNSGVANLTLFVNAPDWSLDLLKSKWRESLSAASRLSRPALYEHFALLSYASDKMRDRLRMQEYHMIIQGDYRLETTMGDGEASLTRTVRDVWELRHSLLFDRMAIGVLRHTFNGLYKLATEEREPKTDQTSSNPTENHRRQLYIWHQNILAAIGRLDDKIRDLLDRFRETETAIVRMLSLRESRALHHHTREITLIARTAERSGIDMQLMTKRMERDARLMKFLAEVTAFFLPITAVATVFSMDFFSVSDTSKGLIPTLDKFKFSWLYWVFALPTSSLVVTWWYYKRVGLESESPTQIQEAEESISPTTQSDAVASQQISETKTRAKELFERLKIAYFARRRKEEHGPNVVEDSEDVDELRESLVMVQKLGRIMEIGLDPDHFLEKVEFSIGQNHPTTLD